MIECSSEFRLQLKEIFTDWCLRITLGTLKYVGLRANHSQSVCRQLKGGNEKNAKGNVSERSACTRTKSTNLIFAQEAQKTTTPLFRPLKNRYLV